MQQNFSFFSGGVKKSSENDQSADHFTEICSFSFPDLNLICIPVNQQTKKFWPYAALQQIEGYLLRMCMVPKSFALMPVGDLK